MAKLVCIAATKKLGEGRTCCLSAQGEGCARTMEASVRR
ncbi:hypothetical protein CGRA01v4_07485 [Colletotrichum graminicola]|nr:hypothetical protein CGRA01v4_07485 [Colletotrichum graminicola]